LRSSCAAVHLADTRSADSDGTPATCADSAGFTPRCRYTRQPIAADHILDRRIDDCQTNGSGDLNGDSALAIGVCRRAIRAADIPDRTIGQI